MTKTRHQTTFQIFSLCVMASAMGLFAVQPGGFSPGYPIAVVALFLIQAGASALLTCAFRRANSNDFFSFMSTLLSAPLSRLVLLIVTVLLALRASVTLSAQTDAVGLYLLEDTSGFAVMLILLLTAFFALMPGIRRLSGSAVLFTLILPIPILIILIPGLLSIEPGRLRVLYQITPDELLSSFVPAAITAATAAGRIMEITRLPAEEIHSKEQVDHLLQTGSGIGIRVEDVCFTYRSGKEVFQNVVFQAEPGEVVALVGPSGGGKTTLLRLMLGMMPVQAGSIQLCGGEPELKLCASASTRALFSYVPQDNTLFSGTIAENLRITNPNATNDMLRDALKMACADEFVSALPDGLDSRVGESGDGLSKGQIQRICIARALLSDAPVLLLDEATSALDVKTERTLLENIQHFRKGRTCIVTTHRASVLSICQRAYLIQNQAVTQVEEGKLRQMMEEF